MHTPDDHRVVEVEALTRRPSKAQMWSAESFTEDPGEVAIVEAYRDHRCGRNKSERRRDDGTYDGGPLGVKLLCGSVGMAARVEASKKLGIDVTLAVV